MPESSSAVEAEEFTRLFAALSDVTRVRILNALAGGELCVCDIVELLELPQSTASRHLAVLRDEGLVAAERRGRFMHYRLGEQRNRAAATLLEGVRRAIGESGALDRERRRAADRSLARRTAPCPV